MDNYLAKMGNEPPIKLSSENSDSSITSKLSLHRAENKTMPTAIEGLESNVFDSIGSASAFTEKNYKTSLWSIRYEHHHHHVGRIYIYIQTGLYP